MKKGLLLLFVLLSAIGLRAQDATVVGDTLSADTTTIVVGKTYIIGEQYVRKVVKFTAEKDGFLKITSIGKKISSGSAKVNGGNANVTKDNATGSITKGLVAGSVFTSQIYTNSDPATSGPYAFTVEFEEGKPYEDLVMTLANPAQGGEWSGAAKYKTYGKGGVAHFEFSSLLNKESFTASIKVGDKVYSPVKATVDTYYGKVDIDAMPDTMSAAIEAGLLKAGDSFTLTLSGIVDKEFSANTLKDTTFTYTLASTACTGVTPAASSSRTVLPEEVVFSFDGAVLIDNAKFYYVNKNTGAQTELTGATVEGTDLKIPVAGIEGLLPKLYDIVAVGVTDANGKVITYGSTEGQLTVSYGTGNSYFKPTMAPANYENVSSLKTYTATFPGAVVYDASLASDTEMVIAAFNESAGFSAIDSIKVSYAISEETPNVITFTLSSEITAPGDYRLEIPGKLFWAKDLYDAENLSTSTCYYMSSQYITCTILPYGPAAVMPADGSKVNKLDVITLDFDENVLYDDEALVTVLEQTEVEGGWGYEVVLDTIAQVSLSDNYEDYSQLLINVGNIDSVGTYVVVVPEGSIWAEGNESKKIGEWTYTYTVDPDYWDPEWVEKPVGTTESEPAQLVAGRKYEFSDMYAYLTYTAEEDGRLYFTPLDERTYLDLTRCDETWYNQGNLSKNEEGAAWIGVEAGKTVYLTDYGFGARLYQVTFEAGSPYDPIQYTGSYPVDGGLLSVSIESPKSWEMGAVEFYFNTKVNKETVKVYMVIPSQNDKKVDITEDISLVDGKVYGTTTCYLAVVFESMLDALKEENGLKAGDKIQVVLENVQDAYYASNVLAENPKVEVTLAATVCTSVNPDSEYGLDSIPGNLSLRFDGSVVVKEGKGWIIDTKSGEKQEFTIGDLKCDTLETWSGIAYELNVELPKATVELTSKQFAIQLEGIVDAEGNVLSHGNEVGKFVIDYKLRDDNFNYVTVDPAEGDVTSIKTTKLTFADKVNLLPNAEDYPTVWVGENEITGTLAIDPNDEKSVIITWSEEITAAGEYYPNIPKGLIYDGKFDASKEDYGVADGAGYNPYISLEYAILADVSATTVASITPAAYEGWGSSSINNLPDSVVIEFNGNVKEVVNAYGEISRWSTVPADAITLNAEVKDNKVIVFIPAEVIASVTTGYFNITVNAVGEDGKPIGSVSDPYAENITFQYYIYKTLQMVESTPAEGETVKELSTVTMTFDSNIAEIDAMWEAPCLLGEDWSKIADMAYSFEGKQLTLSLAEPVDSAGKYIVYVPGDIIYDENWIANSAIELNVTVDPNPAEEQPLVIVSATPEDFASVENLTTVEFKLNKEVGYLHSTMLIPADGGDDAASASLSQSETDPTSYTLDFTIGGFLKDGATLRKDVTYTLTLEAWASEEAYNYNQGTPEVVTLSYVGTSEGIRYSDVTLESITPAEDFVITDKTQNKFVVKFSGAVEMVESLTYINMGQGATQTFESIVANDDKTEYTLTIAESVLETLRTTVYIVFAANDLEGNRVQGTSGEGEFSCFAVEYATTIGIPDLTVAPDAAAEQASLNTFTIGCAEGITPSWTAGNITLTDANGNAIALNDPEAVIPADKASDWSYVPTEWTVSLKEELTTIGAYTLTIPAGYFNIGSTQGQVLSSKETVVVFNITEEARGIKGIALDADADVVVYNVAGVVVANGKASEVLKSLTKGIYIVNGKKYVVK